MKYPVHMRNKNSMEPGELGPLPVSTVYIVNLWPTKNIINNNKNKRQIEIIAKLFLQIHRCTLLQFVFKKSAYIDFPNCFLS